MSTFLSDHHLSIVPSPTPTIVRARYHPREFSKDFAILQRGHPEQDDSGQPPPCIFPPPPCQGPNCDASPLPPCIPLSSHRPPTGIPTFSPIPTTSTGHPSGPYSTLGDTSTTGHTSATPSASSPTAPTVTVSSTGTSIPATGPHTHDPAHPLTAVQIAGIALGGVLGVVFLGVFFWLLRRGTFGSGTLFGFRYGDARNAGWRPDLGEGNVGAEMSHTEKGTGSVGNLVSPFADPGTTLPSYPSSTLAASVPSFPFIPAAKLHHSPSLSSLSRAPECLPPMHSPAVWSTSSSAFDNAYGSIVAGCPSTTCPSTSGSRSHATPSDVLSDVSTLVSERMLTPRSARTPSSYIRRTATSSPAEERESYLSVAQTDVVTGMRTPSPAPTSSAASTIEGVRISSWHSSDSEETGLIVRR
ncbi:hypothetical protein C8T65DRAFT_30575 [Cerioporus squamosus]|nr:hypothetical protein C8T65DRAFT_30575 [Cerioporus squamosus]